MPKVSIIMNCYNSEKYLEETLQSLLMQSYQNWQLVFVDNCSTDHSIEILNRCLENDSRLLYLRTPHHMPLGEAREFGLERCSGDMICFLDTDDVWCSEKLSKQISLMQQYHNIILSYCGYYFINAQSKITGKKDLIFKMGDLFGINLANYEINFQTVMIRKEALDLIERPYFSSALKFSPDYNLFMRILACGPALSLDEKLVKYRKTGNSLTSKTIDLWGIESEYTYEQLHNSGVLQIKSTEMQRKHALAKIAYYKAASAMLHKEHSKAKALLKPYRILNYKYAALYLLSASPLLWETVHRWRNS